MFFANEIILVDEIRCEVNVNLEIWKYALKSKSFQISRTKIENISCKVSKIRNEDNGVVRLDGQKIPMREKFRYLRWID